MLIDGQGIELRAEQTVYTLCARAAYRVVRGSVHVCIVEHTQEGMTKRDACVCRADAASGLVIPALASMPDGEEMLCFAIEADEGGARLERVPFTEGQPARFLRASGASPALLGLLEARLPHMDGAAPREETADNTLMIPEASSFMADCPEASYCVMSGTVDVFLAPVEKTGMSGRREFLCRAVPGEGFAIPGLRYEADGRSWHLTLEARDGAARLLRLGCTRVAREKFLAAVQAQAGGETIESSFLMEAYAHEGFEQSLVQAYVRKTDLADAIRESRQSRSREDIRQRVQSAIRSGVGEGPSQEAASQMPLLQVLRYLCQRGEIRLEEEALARCVPGMSLPAVAGQCGLLCREVELEKDWYRDDRGLLVCSLEGRPVACIPRGGGGYRLYDPAVGREVRVDARLAGQLRPRAYAVGQALPARSLRRRDIILHALRAIRRGELLAAALLSLLYMPAVLALPALIRAGIDLCILGGNPSGLFKVCLLACVLLLLCMSLWLLAQRRSLRICMRAERALQSAMLARIFALPERLLARYESGELARKLQMLGRAAGRLAGRAAALAASAVYVPVLLIQMAHHDAALIPGAMLLMAAIALLAILLSVSEQRDEMAASENNGEAASRLQQFLSGIEKIQMAGAEEHVLLASIQPIAGQQRATSSAERTRSLRRGLRGAGGVLLAVLLLMECGRAPSPGSAVAFGAAFCGLLFMLKGVVDALTEYRLLATGLERLRPLIEAVPETDARGGDTQSRLDGRIALEHVTFSYSPDSEPVLRDVSFELQPGEYVGLTGRSGSGKSTILRLLLGFDSPQVGRVLFDGRDIAALNKRSLRRQMGVVLQGDSLIAGSIYENIMMTSERPSRRAAEAAAHRAGLKEELEAMPMGLDTMLHGSFETISGGQKQRILLARAIADSPAVLLLDEATSALDNVTQAAVCRSLKQMSATRLVIAHRPEALADCDRILVLDEGRIVEEGSYAQLDARGGLFHEFIRRQSGNPEEGEET